MTLTAKVVEQAKPGDKPYKLSDQSGLYLFVAPTGLKSWRKNYLRSGKQATVTFGRWPEMTLAAARRANAAFDTSAASKQADSFETVFREWLRCKLPTLSNAKHQLQVQNTVERLVLPSLGALLIDRITRKQFVSVVQSIDRQGIVETAHRVAGRISQIMDYAVDTGRIDSHGANNLTRVLTPRVIKRHMPSILPEDAAKLLADIDGYPDPVTRLALRFAALTFVRTGELRGMRWAEINHDAKVWIIPAERMKNSINKRLPHVVPLSIQAIDLLADLSDINGHREHVFDSPARHGHPISENTMLFALYRMGYKWRMTGHGFRSLASTVLNEQSPFRPDVIERQLAHKESDDVRAAYNRADYLDQRIELMQWWADWIDRQILA